MDQKWFEMRDIRRKKMDDAAWVALRANETVREEGQRWYAGHVEEYFGLGSLAVPLKQIAAAESLGWMDIGLRHDHKGWVEGRKYLAADVFPPSKVKNAIALVLSQRGNSVDQSVWHLHQDIVITLGLKLEGDSWLAIDEGYVEVARLRRDRDGTPTLLEIKAEHFKDYLCARGMALLVSWYRKRQETFADAAQVEWVSAAKWERDTHDRWEIRAGEVHEGGDFFGGSAHVVHVTRTDVDVTEDVPKIGPFDQNIAVKSWTKTSERRKLHPVFSELWRNEWVMPAKTSPRVREDKVPPTAFFITNAAGKKETWKTLRDAGQWLWFKPEVINAALRYRGATLGWYTRHTGNVSLGPDGGVPFGVNKLGLVNVYAKDIAFLPEWQQTIWAGFNVGPDAGVSAELLASQSAGEPADTQAPERFLSRGIELLNDLTANQFGFKLFRPHEHTEELLASAHRFRALSRAGLLSLAKDLARLTADSIDTTSLHKLAPPPDAGKKLGSLKSLELFLAKKAGSELAHQLLSPLHAIYNLRLGDAHLPGKELEQAFTLVHINQKEPFVVQGLQLMDACVSTLYSIARVLRPKGKDMNA